MLNFTIVYKESMVTSSYSQYVCLITKLIFIQIFLRIKQVIQNYAVLSRIVQCFLK